MSESDWSRFNDAMEKIDRIARLMGLFKAAIVSAFSVCVIVTSMAIWANSSENKQQRTAEEVHALLADRAERIKEWDLWRKQKDEIDIRLTYVIEAQQKAIDRIAR